MSNPDKDYSNTIIYKITCKDPNIHDVYVGHTVNFVQRKKAHQLSCMKSSSPSHNCKVYQVIRNNGGWENWIMSIIAFYNCKDLSEARQREQEHFVALNATLNSVEPFPLKSVNRANRVNRVNRVKRVRSVGHKVMNNVKKRASYICELCDFKCCKQSIFNKHLDTNKHKTNNINIQDTSNIQPVLHSNNIGYVCPYCLKSYKYHSGIWRHKKECKKNNTNLQHGEPHEDDDHTLQSDNVIIHNKVNHRQQIREEQIKNLTAEHREIKIEMARLSSMLSIVAATVAANNAQIQLQLLEMIKNNSPLARESYINVSH